MKPLRLLLIGLLAALGWAAEASSTYTCNGNTYIWPDQFLNYGYNTYWPLQMNDCLTQISGNVTAAQTAVTTAQAAALTATTSAATQGTSTTSLTIGTGTQSLTVQTGKGYLPNMPVRIANSAGAGTMDGTVTSYNSSTGALVVSVTSTSGSGTIATWNVFLEGPVGATGAAGAAGINGTPQLISTLTANNTSSSLSWTNLGTTYQNYLLVINGLTPAITDTFLVQMGTGTGPTWVTSGYSRSAVYQIGGSAVSGNYGGGAGQNSLVVFPTNIPNSPAGLTGNLIFSNISSGVDSMLNGQLGWPISSTDNASETVWGILHSNATAKTSIRIITSGGGNLLSGTASLYGLQN